MNNPWMNTTLDNKRLENEYYRFHRLASKCASYGQYEMCKRYLDDARQVREALHSRGYKNY